MASNCSIRSHSVALARAATACVMLLSCGRQLTDRERLHAAYDAAKARPVTLRLSGFDYRPAPRRLRGNDDPAVADLRLQSEVFAVASATRDPHVGAIARLLGGRVTDARKALERFTTTTADSEAWNDLAVALYEDAIATGSARTLARALAAVDEAIDGAHRPEALFNRATILETLGLTDAAATAWKAYLASDGNSEWASEAHERLRACSSRPTTRQKWSEVRPRLEAAITKNDAPTVAAIVRAYPHETRAWGEGMYPSLWAEAFLAGDSAHANQQLAMARAIGVQMRELRGDSLLERSVAVIDEAQQSGNASTLRAIAKAYLAYRDGRLAIKNSEQTAAVRALERADSLFTRAASPMRLVARYFTADVSIELRRVSTAMELLRSVEADASPDFHVLRAEQLWARARAAARTGQFYAALDDAQAATDAFERLGDREHATQTRIVAAGTLSTLGRPEDAWKLRRQIFEAATESGSASIIETAVYSAAKEEIVENELSIARAFFNVLLEAPAQQPLLHFDGRLWRDFVTSHLDPGYAADMRALHAAADSLADPAERELARAETSFAEALLTRNDNKRRMDLLTEAIEFRQHDYGAIYLATAQIERARVRRETGDVSGAVDDLRQALETIEKQAATISDAALRDSFFGSAQTACLELADLHLEQQQTTEALGALERCRGGAAFSLAEVQRSLPARTVIVDYALFEKRLVGFLITRQRLRTFEVPRRREDIEADLSALLHDREPETRLRTLYDTFLAPIEADVASCDTLVVASSDAADRVPFGALLPRRAADEPSRLNVILAPRVGPNISGGVQSASPPIRALVVGDPAFDSRRFSSMQRLSGAATEARAVHALYRNGDLLVADDATIAGFRQFAADADIIHVAAHAVISDRDSDASVLLFAPSSDDDGLFYVRDVKSAKLPRRPLVVLTGCETGSRGGGRGSVRSLAAAFLAAGSRSTVASLWPVDDDISRVFALALHRALRDGMTLAAATRAARLEMKRSADPRVNASRAWGAFQVYGNE